MSQKELVINGRKFKTRLFIGTGKFANNALLAEAIKTCGIELVTVALKRVDLTKKQEDSILKYLDIKDLVIAPNTSGARNAEEAVRAGEYILAAGFKWIKLEIHPDPYHLLPDPVETYLAAEKLCKLGMTVLPYINADPVLCKRLEDCGCPAVMPLAAPIGTNQGLKTRSMLEIIIEKSNVPVIIDAGLGAPSHAAECIELGTDAVLVNTAIAAAADPIKMTRAFKLAIDAAENYIAAGPDDIRYAATASSPLTDF